MKALTTVSAIALSAALAQGAFSLTALADPAPIQDNTLQNEAAPESTVEVPLIVEDSFIGQTVYSADTGEELGTIESVEVNTETPSQVTVALDGESSLPAQQLVISEDQLSLNADGRIVAALNEEQREFLVESSAGIESSPSGEPMDLDPSSGDVATSEPEADDTASTDLETGSITTSSTREATLPGEDYVDRAIFDPEGEQLGVIRDVIAAGDKPQFVLGYGGFLGLFESRVLVPYDDVTEDAKKRLVASLSREQLEDLPAY